LPQEQFLSFVRKPVRKNHFIKELIAREVIVPWPRAVPRQKGSSTDFRQPSKLENISYGILAGAGPGSSQGWQGSSGKKFAHAAGGSLPYLATSLGYPAMGSSGIKGIQPVKLSQVWSACCSFKP
jgi:hypothetical protein